MAGKPGDDGAADKSAGATIATLPRCASAADLDRLHGRRVRIEGRYEVEPVAGSKRLQAACVVLADGTRVIHGYRPEADKLAYHDKRVVVVGTVYRDANQPSDVQQVMAPHISIERIELAAGEVPYAVAPSEVPSPPLARGAAELVPRGDRFVQVLGVVDDLSGKPDDSFWVDARVRLADGTLVEVTDVPASRWQPLRGGQVTAVGRLRAERSPDQAVRYRLVECRLVIAGHLDAVAAQRRPARAGRGPKIP